MNGQTWEQVAEDVVSKIFEGKDLTDDQRATLAETIRAIAAANGEHYRSGLVRAAWAIRATLG